MTRYFRIATIAASLCLAASSGIAGSIVFDNTAFALPAGTNVMGASFFDSFSTGAASGPLSGLELVLGDQTPSDGGAITVSLYSDAPGCGPSCIAGPGSFIANIGTVQDSSLGLAASIVPVSLTSNPTLAAGTRYWIFVTGASLSVTGPYWANASAASGLGVSTEFSGVGNYPYTTASVLTFDSSTAPRAMQVTVGGSAGVAGTPEPGSLWLGGIGLVAMLSSARLLKRQGSSEPSAGV